MVENKESRVINGDHFRLNFIQIKIKNIIIDFIKLNDIIES